MRDPLRRIGALIVALALGLTPFPALAADDDTAVDIDGGGWGHGIGMPQYAARGQAEEGKGYRAILRYWYQGIGFKDVSKITGVPETIRVGINYVTVGTQREYRPFKWLDFEAIGGKVSICLDGQTGDDCSFKARPDQGEVWRIAWDDAAGCVLTRNLVVRHSGACGIHLEWKNQPDTRVVFPELARTFARGKVFFLAPRTAPSSSPLAGQKGFHIVVELTLEKYLFGLAEMPVSWPMNALKAQVVAARTFAAWKASRGIRSDCSCHLVWDTADQAYRGWHPLNEGNADDGHRWRKAVNRTAGKVVVHPDGSTSIAETYYHSSTGGASENVWDVWGPDTPEYRAKYSYLASQPDKWSELYAGQTSTIRWTRHTTAGQIVDALSGGSSPLFPHLTELVSMTVEGVRASGSPNRVAVAGIAAGHPTIDAYTGNQLVSPLGLTSHYIYSFDGLDPDDWLPSNRSQTAVEASQAAYPAGAATVYLTPGKAHPHALALEPAAAADDAPILMLEKDGSPGESTREELQRLGPSRVVVAAPKDLVPKSVLDQLESLLPGAEIARIAGSNRFQSAAAVTAEVFAPGVDTVWIGGRAPYPTALLAAHAATSDRAPMLPVKPDKIPKAIRDELERLDPARIVVVGNPDDISAAVVTALAAHAPDVDRISAGNEHRLSVEVSEREFPGGADTVYLSIGRSHPYALAGSVAIDADPGPTLLIRSGEIPAVVRDELARLKPERIVILSRPKKVSPAVLAELAGYVHT
jgi:peptidoglycan hydrolase-like amidase/putative cell wall-binding protein